MYDVVDEAAKSIEDIDPNVAVEKALGEYRLLQERLFRSQEAGVELSEFVRSQYAVKVAVERIQTYFADLLSGPMVALLEIVAGLARVAEFWAKKADENKELLGNILGTATLMTGVPLSLLQITQILREIGRQTEEDVPVGNFIDDAFFANPLDGLDQADNGAQRGIPAGVGPVGPEQGL